MTKEQANKFIGKKVQVTFKKEWYNEAACSWVEEDTQHIGILRRCENESQKNFYFLEELKGYVVPTTNACWSANMMKSIKEV